ncbi:cation-translocating P-type ATPase [Roseomonas rosulenta]|uniref:cation-translocating P-type ATPase n=1 Tax=Roseomonas rosulenta TaxID=2748667 RepID=UPI001E4B8DF2|nr:cation-translocating P-type ATPase [Roseomonas rosulenta]
MPDAPMTRENGGGLSEREAAARLKADGPNELARAGRRTPFRIVLEVLREPMLALLLGGGVLYLLLGSPEEALILLAFALFSIVITVVQESRTERVLEALRDLTSPRALVIRGGERKRIAGREVVRGDLVVLAEGDRVPADARLIEASDVQTDESLLTGESVPVRKVASATLPPARPGGDDLPHVFSGSLVVRGSGIAEVTATGPHSEIGRIGQSLSALDPEPPRLQAQMRRLVKFCAIFGGVVSVLAVLLYGTLRGGWLDALLAGIAIGMSMVPEELPVVLTVFMAMGAWRISKARVLTRRAASIETLGSATVLCTDKTGTLTQNRMTVAVLCLPDGSEFHPQDGAIPQGFRLLVETGRLASVPQPFDPMEKAFHAMADGMAQPALDLIRTYGLRPDLLAMTNIWRSGTETIVATKGAPEAIALLCHLDAEARAALIARTEVLAAKGMRVLAVARATHSGEAWPETQDRFAFRLLGLVGLADPLRPGVVEAVAECRTAGIRVVMITGDYPTTAAAIARQAGLDAETIVTGEALSGMDDATLAAQARSTTVFARVMPEQKLRIVAALKADGEVVAMTGDGVNDAPSLKAAHIGIAMGGRGTDVAREASSLVLLDDDFGSIVAAVRLGRRVFDNLRKSMGFIIAIHLPIAGLALLPLIFGLPILLWPMHIAFLEMMIDPVCTLVFEAETEEEGIMQRPPRDPAAPLFSASLLGWSVLQGAVVLAPTAGIYLVALDRGMPEPEVRSLTFFALVISIVGLIFVNRSFSASIITAFRRRNAVLRWVMLAVTVMLGVTLALPFAQRMFRFGPLHPDDLAVTVTAGLATILILEFLKPHWRKRLMT